MSKPNPTRNLTRGAQHETFGPDFKRLNVPFRRYKKYQIKRRMAVENAATKMRPDSWSDVLQRRAERLAMLREAHQRSLALQSPGAVAK